MPTVGDPLLAKELDEMAKRLLQLSNTGVRAATRVAMNRTIISTRELAAKRTSSKYKVQISRVKSIAPIKTVKSYNNLKASITVVEVPIPLISLITNTRGDNKGGLKKGGFISNRPPKGKVAESLKVMRSIAQVRIKLGKGDKFTRSMGRLFIATTREKGKKTHIFQKVSEGKSPRGKRSHKKGAVFVPKIHIQEMLIPEVAGILNLKMNTSYLTVLKHEYKWRTEKALESSKRR